MNLTMRPDAGRSISISFVMYTVAKVIPINYWKFVSPQSWMAHRQWPQPLAGRRHRLELEFLSARSSDQNYGEFFCVVEYINSNSVCIFTWLTAEMYGCIANFVLDVCQKNVPRETQTDEHNSSPAESNGNTWIHLIYIFSLFVALLTTIAPNTPKITRVHQLWRCTRNKDRRVDWKHTKRRAFSQEFETW